jgi:UDP-N-acetylglucosamine acyltransferase
MMATIHATAIVEDGAELGEGVRIGPYCTVGPQAKLGDDVVLRSHVVVDGRTMVGARTEIYPFTVIGLRPQDLKFGGEPSALEIGTDNVIREHVTMHTGTAGGGMVTRLGNGCLLMVGVHLAHDCQVGNGVILGNNTGLAGHVVVQDFAITGGHVAVHQFCRIGRYSMIGGASAVDADIIPYGLAMGNRGQLQGLNLIGLKRRSFSRERINNLRHAYRMLFAQEGTLQERVADVAGMFAGNDEVAEIVEFIKADSSRPLCLPAPERS